MRILGVDPGPRESAYCAWDGQRIIESGKVDSKYILDLIYKASTFQESRVACEHIQCFGLGVGKEVFETAYWIGEFRCFSGLHNIEFVPVFRSEVKQHHCHSARATDSNIRYALIDRFGDKGTKKAPGLTYPLKGDLWSAFAIAVMTFDKLHNASIGAAHASDPVVRTVDEKGVAYFEELVFGIERRPEFYRAIANAHNASIGIDK